MDWPPCFPDLNPIEKPLEHPQEDHSLEYKAVQVQG